MNRRGFLGSIVAMIAAPLVPLEAMAKTVAPKVAEAEQADGAVGYCYTYCSGGTYTITTTCEGASAWIEIPSSGATTMVIS